MPQARKFRTTEQVSRFRGRGAQGCISVVHTPHSYVGQRDQCVVGRRSRGALISPPCNIQHRRINANTNLVRQCVFTAAFLHLASLLAAEAAACPVAARQGGGPHASLPPLESTDHRILSQERAAHFEWCAFAPVATVVSPRSAPVSRGENASSTVDQEADRRRSTRCGAGSGGADTWNKDTCQSRGQVGTTRRLEKAQGRFESRKKTEKFSQVFACFKRFCGHL